MILLKNILDDLRNGLNKRGVSMSSHDSDVITGYLRTPIGDFQGFLSKFTAAELGAIAIQGALNRSGVEPQQVDEVLMGCMLTTGIG